MRSKRVNDTPLTYVLVLDSGDEVVKELISFAENERITAAGFTAIGAFSSAMLGYFDFSIKDYKKIPVDEQVEVLSLSGDISLYQGDVKLHAHAIVGKANGSAHGGHLLSAIVKPTLEVVLTAMPAHIIRRMDPESGIPLIELS